MRFNYKRVLIGVIAAADILVVAAALYFLCGSVDYSVNQKQNCHTIGVSYMTMNNEFYTILNEEIAAKVESEGDMFMLYDPALDEEKQLEQIDRMLDEKIDVLVVTPVNRETLTPALERARREGVRVIVVDSEADDEDIADCTIKSDNYNAGVQIGRLAAADGRKKRFVLLTHNTAKSGVDRMQGFKDTVASADNIEIVAELECEGQLELAEPALNDFIKTGRRFDAVFALNDLAAVGAVAALEENGLLENTEIYGVDGAPDAKGLIKENIMKATAAQFPTEIGKKTGDVIYELLAGKPVQKQILVPTELIDSENLDRYGVERWQ